MNATRRSHFRRWFAAFMSAATLASVGCDGFFVRESSGGSSSNSGNYLYVSNSASGSSYVNEYDLASGTLVALSGSPFSINSTPSALAVSAANTFLYAATSTGAIYVYTINSDGTLKATITAPVASDNVSSMDISPDGKYLFTLNSTGLLGSEYQIDTSTGKLTFASSLQLPGTGTITPAAVRVSPSGKFVVFALGTAGDVVFPFNSSTGVVSPSYAAIATGSATSGDYAIALDKNDYLYVARTSGVAVYSLAASGAGTQVSGSPFAAGNGPHSIVLNSAGDHVYVGNQTDGTISAFGIGANGLLTSAGAAVAAPGTVASLARDKSGKYIAAVGYDASAGIRLYAIGSTGALTQAGSGVGTGTATGVPAVLALTH